MKIVKRLLLATVFVAGLSTVGTSSACVGDVCAHKVIVGDCRITVQYKFQHPVDFERTGEDGGLLHLCELLGTK